MEKCTVNKGYFLITIDTEGDNLWLAKDIKGTVTTENAKYLFRFQELCEKYGFVVTYLTNYEMALDPQMIELGRSGIKKGTVEIGSHIHAWNQPPYFPLIKRIGDKGKPFLGEYPKLVIYRKLERLTKLLEDTFQCRILSHRGGRWYMDQEVLQMLEELGYIADCTFTPGISWKETKGWGIGSYGSCYKNSPNTAFYPIYKARGKSRQFNILEIPVTIDRIREGGAMYWLRPNGKNLQQMKALVKKAQSENREYVEFMLHSSEFMPGGSPLFRNKGMVDYLFRDLEDLFAYAIELGYQGCGVSNYANCYIDQ